jgi:type IV secretory pathway VirB2 component (pilin)
MSRKNKAVALLAVLAPAVAATGVAVAYDATTDTVAAGTAEMNNALDLLIAFLDGPLGTIFAIVAFGIGLGVSAMTQSMMGLAAGIFVALLANYGAAIIVGVTGAAESNV